MEPFIYLNLKDTSEFVCLFFSLELKGKRERMEESERKRMLTAQESQFLTGCLLIF